MVEIVRIDPETTISCVRLTEKLYKSKREGKEEGKIEGRIEGRIEGKAEQLVSLVCKKMKKNKTVEEIAEELESEVSAIEPIYNVAKGFAPEYDPQLVFDRLIHKAEAKEMDIS